MISLPMFRLTMCEFLQQLHNAFQIRYAQIFLLALPVEGEKEGLFVRLAQ